MNRLTKLLGHNETYLGAVIVVFALIITIVNPAFIKLDNLFGLMKSSSGTAILAIGFLLVLLTGEVDVSAPAIAISAQYIAVNTLIAIDSNNLLLAFVIAVAIGLAYGAINAFFITTFKLPALIVTLGTANLFHGGLLEFVGTKAVNTGQLPDAFKVFGHTSIFNLTRADGSTYGLSIFIAVVAVVLLVTWFILRFTLMGRGIYAIGGDAESARRAGLNTKRIQYFIYMYVGLLSGIMGILHISLIRYGNPNYIVDTELLRVIAAVVLGGAVITGGKGTLVGTILGVTMIIILEKNLVLIGLSSYWQQFFVGLIIVVGVAMTHIQATLRSHHKVVIIKSQ